jgi:hypothetical protein
MKRKLHRRGGLPPFHLIQACHSSLLGNSQAIPTMPITLAQAIRKEPTSHQLARRTCPMDILNKLSQKLVGTKMMSRRRVRRPKKKKLTPRLKEELNFVNVWLK